MTVKFPTPDWHRCVLNPSFDFDVPGQPLIKLDGWTEGTDGSVVLVVQEPNNDYYHCWAWSEDPRPTMLELALPTLWLQEYETDGGRCKLCGGRGRIDCRETRTADGTKVNGGVVFCICPNGRAHKQQVGS